MRVTNGMLMNTTLNGLYKNMSNLNKTYAQMTSGKKIQTVSDDPIIAGRALKLKTTVLETDQYTTNIKEANSWMEITDGALANITEILKQIRTKVNQAANSTLEAADKQAIQTEISQLWEQLQEEVNVTYNGRYVFSGYKTNEPLVLTENTAMDRDITLSADLMIKGDMTSSDGAVVNSLGSGSVLPKDSAIPEGSILAKGTILSKKDAETIYGADIAGSLSDDSYKLASDYVIAEGTKLSKDAVDAIEAGIGQAIDVKQDGEYYVVEAGGLTVPKGTTINGADVCKEMFGFKPSAQHYQTTSAYSVPTGGYKVSGSITVAAETTLNGNMTLMNGTELKSGSVLAEGSVLKEGSVIPAGTLNPKVNGRIDNDQMEYQVGVNSTIAVNSLGMDKIFGSMTACFEEIYTDITAALNGNMTNADLSKNFSAKLGELDEILAAVSDAASDLGSKVARAEYVQSRLVDQKTTFKNLLSETEDIDVEEVYTNFNIQYATYQSALQATSKIITNTLADYL